MKSEISNALSGMLLDGVAATQGVDKSAERLLIENCDLSSVSAGEATWLWEHRKGANSTPLDVVGSIRSAKKIFSEDDCANDREKYWWGEVRQPLIYYTCRLYDGAGHPGALAVAAQIRDHYANGEKIVVRSSIDGSTLEREGNILKSTIFRHLAATIQPCNNSCDTGVLDDPMIAKLNLQKREGEINVCAIATECVPGRGPLLEDPGARPYPPERAQQLIAVARRTWADLRKAVLPEKNSLVKYHEHDGRSAFGIPIHEPSRTSDRHAEAWKRASSDRRAVDLHDKAMEGWRRARERLLAGDVTRRDAEHASLVSGIQLAGISPGPILKSLTKSAYPDPAISMLHEAVVRRRDDGLGVLRDLGLDGDPRGGLMLAHLGYSQFAPVDSALAQNRFGCDEEQAQRVLAEGKEWMTGWDHGDCCGIRAALPASWLHWLAAPRYALTAGLPAVAGDRSGLWEASMPPNGGPWPADQTAALERGWSRRFGDVGALMLYFIL